VSRYTHTTDEPQPVKEDLPTNAVHRALIGSRPRSVADIAKFTGKQQEQVAQALQKLEAGGLVRRAGGKLWVDMS
jgi:predicted Rossmann fold nucleotide-binding protein DprA/Smf involved in DNA uptake